jgi:hypothetical protein
MVQGRTFVAAGPPINMLYSMINLRGLGSKLGVFCFATLTPGEV